MGLTENNEGAKSCPILSQDNMVSHLCLIFLMFPDHVACGQSTETQSFTIFIIE